jgi:hypothetical protein
MLSNEGELKKEVRIEHKPSKDYASHTATGGLLSGPTSDGFYHLAWIPTREIWLTKFHK